MLEQLHVDILNLGYEGRAKEIDVFCSAFTKGPPNIIYVDVAFWLSSHLVTFFDLENKVTPIFEEERLEGEALGFLVEFSSLLNELRCPIKHLVKRPVRERLVEPEEKTLAMVYLAQELAAGKILLFKKPKKEAPTLKIELSESKTAKDLREMLISLKFGKPPDNITPRLLFTELEKKIYTLSQPLSPKDKVGELLFSGHLTEKQWFQLVNLYEEMYQEYKNRKNLLLTRLDVTIQSFLWSDRLKNKSEEILNIYNKRKSGIVEEPTVKISDILSATKELTIIDKTSSAAVRKNTKCAVNKVMIGAVPDRGGRPEEQQPPPPEVPSWQKNDFSSRGGMRPQRGASNYRNTGDRGPNRNTDNRSSNDNYQKSEHFSNNRDNYTRGRGDYNSAHTPVYQPVQYVVQQPVQYGGQPVQYGGQPPIQFSGPPQPVQYGGPPPPIQYGGPPPPIQYGGPPPPIQYGGQLGISQFGFGGYMAAGDNFQQFGMNDGINQNQSRQNTGSVPRQRGGHNNRGGYNDRGSKPFRGQGRGRGRW